MVYGKLEEDLSGRLKPNLPAPARFFKGVPVKVEVLGAEKYADNKYVWYKIQVEHGDFKWTMEKKLVDVLSLERSLNNKLLLFKLISHSDEVREELEKLEKNRPKDSISSLPYIRTSAELKMLAKAEEVIAQYLDYVVQYEVFKTDQCFSGYLAKFFEISPFTFHPALGQKGKEAPLKKYSYRRCCDCLNWTNRYFVAKDSFLMYLDSGKTNIEGIFLYDRETEVDQRADDHKILRLKNSSFSIDIKCNSIRQANLWRVNLKHQVKQFNSIFEEKSRSVTGYAPLRHAPVHWFVDGSSFFSAIADALEGAKEEIFIAGFQLNPSLYMRRNSGLKEEDLLISILEKKANEGVKIYIFIYDDIKTVNNQGQGYAKRQIEALNSENIFFLKHRGELLEGTLLYVHHEKLVVIDQNTSFVSGIDLAFGRWDYHRHPISDIRDPLANGHSNMAENNEVLKRVDHPIPGQLWRGMDYDNAYKHTNTDYTEPFQDKIDRNSMPRMPWHDIGSVTYHEAARDVARHFIQRWNFTRATENEDGIPFLLPKSNPTKKEKATLALHPLAVEADVQVIRSASKWSVGLQETERSIQDAYIDAIEESEHFIYIENQFFISIRNHEEVENKVAEALFQRIVKAKVEKKKFRLYVVMPLIPGVQGDYSDEDASKIIQMISYYQYSSISRGAGSLITSLGSVMSQEDIASYVSFCALRSHGEVGGEVKTEVLYVHSKMMIVDDRVTIIGSANLNDRSLNGDRDSEVALLIRDTEMVDSKMDGRKYQVGKFSSQLRKRVFAEHLGMLPDDHDDSTVDFPGSKKLNDVVSGEFYNEIWSKISQKNTFLYNEAFRPVPSDEVKQWANVSTYQLSCSTTTESKRQILEQVKGHLVQFPQKYLEGEELDSGWPNYFTFRMWT